MCRWFDSAPGHHSSPYRHSKPCYSKDSGVFCFPSDVRADVRRFRQSHPAPDKRKAPRRGLRVLRLFKRERGHLKLRPYSSNRMFTASIRACKSPMSAMASSISCRTCALSFASRARAYMMVLYWSSVIEILRHLGACLPRLQATVQSLFQPGAFWSCRGGLAQSQLAR